MTTPIAYQAQHFRTGLYQPDQFLTAFNWTNAQDGNVSPVLRSKFQDENGNTFEGFAKPFSTQDKSQALVTLNEVTGWLLAKSIGLPCADRAFFIPIALNEMPDFPFGNLPAANSNGLVMCFVTESISETAVRGLFTTEELVTEQSKWTHTDKTIAFDEALANADRHPGNLIRKAANDFYLIDHGRLGFIPYRYPIYEDPDSEKLTEFGFENVLHHNCYLFLNRTNPVVTAEGVKNGLDFAKQLPDSIRKNAFELAFWCNSLLPGYSAKWLNFLYSRSQPELMSTLLHKRFGVLSI